jgi:hypothetical protein
MTYQLLATKLENAGFRLFRLKHCSTAKYEAQEALSGITHYVNDQTLKYFKARILKAKPILNNTFYMILESCSMDSHHTTRGFRVIVFDLNGDTVNRPSLEEMRSKPATALKDYENWLKTFNPEDHYKRRIEDKIRSLNHKIELLETF